MRLAGLSRGASRDAPRDNALVGYSPVTVSTMIYIKSRKGLESSARPALHRVYVLVCCMLTLALFIERCPPCFNCQLDAFTCGNFGECSSMKALEPGVLLV